MFAAFCDTADCNSLICCCNNAVWSAAVSIFFFVNTGVAAEMIVPTCGRIALSAGIRHVWLLVSLNVDQTAQRAVHVAHIGAAAAPFHGQPVEA
jgi:hypothetical protein